VLVGHWSQSAYLLDVFAEVFSYLSMIIYDLAQASVSVRQNDYSTSNKYINHANVIDITACYIQHIC